MLSFLTDTSLLVVVAYLLARGPVLSLLFREELTYRQSLGVGLALGAVGLVEALFPDARFSYGTHTLFVTFAAMAGGLGTGLVAAAVVSVGAFLSQIPVTVVGIVLSVFLSAELGRAVRRARTLPGRLAGGFAVGAVAQFARLAIHTVAVGSVFDWTMRRWATVPINGFGLMLLALVVTDAQRRTDSERRRLEAEAARATALRAQLSAVRARVHPHFLFNTLNAIAEMCVVCPERAESATLKLSALMRRTLDAGAGSLAPLAEEIEATRTYLDIEKERLGSRLQVVWDVPADLRSVSAPPFSLQPLVENAVVHGVSRREGQGTVRIRVRVRPSGTSVLVGDDGVGMPEAVVRSALANAEEPADGLSMVQCQLRMAFGPKGRLRVCSRPGQGTIVAFRIPARPSGRLETGAPA